MDDGPRIGRPNLRCDNPEEIGRRFPIVTAPTVFGIPSTENGNYNYHPDTGYVHCSVVRVNSNLYHFAFQVGSRETVAIIASKLKSSRTSNYHLFDALRGGVDAKLSKKAGHYIGKLRRDKDQPPGCYTLYTSSRQKEQVAAFVYYDMPPLALQYMDGQPPRKMQAVIPKSSEGENDNSNMTKTSGATNNNRLVEHIHNGTWVHHNLLSLKTRAPKYQMGQYRLNFNGRVLTPSVKNMQLENSNGECFLQFGKVDENTFHLDYKAPFNAFVAFAAALCQFDL